MADFPEIPAGFGLPLVDLDTDLLPAPTMAALDERYPDAADTSAALATKADVDDLAAVEIVIEGEAAIDAAIAKLDMRAPSTFTCAIASDSTADGTNEWFELAWQAQLAAVWPDRPARVLRWNKTTEVYADPIIWQTAETPAVPPSSGGDVPNSLIGADAFNTATLTEMNGRVPDTAVASGVWTATPGAFKTVSGTVVATYTSGSGFQVYFTPIARSGIDMVANAKMRINSAAGASNKTYQFYGPYLTSTNNIQVVITRNTTGVPTAILRKTIAGVNTTIATFPAGFIPDATTGTYAVNITVAGTAVSATINGVTVSGTITGGDVTALTGTSRVGFGLTGDPDFQFSEFEVRGTVTAPPTGGSPAIPSPLPYATVYNASAAGTSASYQLARLATLYPVRPDVLMVAHGHNYGTDSPATYLAGIDAFVDGFLALYPGVPVWAVSQNPQFTPSATVEQHAARQRALREHAKAKGWAYVPAFEAFAARTDGGLSYISGDGIHPLAIGNTFWRDVAKTAIRSYSRRP